MLLPVSVGAAIVFTFNLKCFVDYGGRVLFDADSARVLHNGPFAHVHISQA